MSVEKLGLLKSSGVLHTCGCVGSHEDHRGAHTEEPLNGMTFLFEKDMLVSGECCGESQHYRLLRQTHEEVMRV